MTEAESTVAEGNPVVTPRRRAASHLSPGSQLEDSYSLKAAVTLTRRAKVVGVSRNEEQVIFGSLIWAENIDIHVDFASRKLGTMV